MNNGFKNQQRKQSLCGNLSLGFMGKFLIFVVCLFFLFFLFSFFFVLLDKWTCLHTNQTFKFQDLNQFVSMLNNSSHNNNNLSFFFFFLFIKNFFQSQAQSVQTFYPYIHMHIELSQLKKIRKGKIKKHNNFFSTNFCLWF